MKMSDEIGIDIDEHAKDRDTDLAYCVIILGDGDLPEFHYFPKSRCRIYSKKRRLYAPDWILMEKGLL